MAEGSNRTVFIVGGLVLVLGSCCCLGAGVAAYFAYGPSQAGVLGGESVTVPPGFVEYAQTIDCTPYNPMLTLTSFRLQHPATQTAELCTEQQPAAYNYVTFYDHDPAGNMTGQFGIGYQVGVIDPTLIDQLVENLRGQMPAGSSFTPTDASPYAARNTSFTRKDYVLVTTAQMGLLAPGTYAFRVVLVPNDVNPYAGGLTLIIMQRADNGDTVAAFAAMETDYRTMIETIHFSIRSRRLHRGRGPARPSVGGCRRGRLRSSPRGTGSS